MSKTWYTGYREPVAGGNERRVDVIDELCRIRHRNLVSVPVEYVQRDTRDQGVSQRGEVSPQVTWIDGGVGVMPGAPLIHYQLYAPLFIYFTHNLPVIRDELLHPVRLEQQLIPFRGRKLIGDATAGGAAI